MIIVTQLNMSKVACVCVCIPMQMKCKPNEIMALVTKFKFPPPQHYKQIG
ncbi:hypothetical protein RchiOBHm_Chr7g0219631 [Rosa chinensis]|uniref:Uncharacterized protein n=1 Tax=Rosa chinensis TaxID=74649 RepID=A0A2P6PCK2_ROSCH|nr:hypothetical protein RchiOBHm_Chr7g0219631 [Rosa chinensis]